VNSLTLGSALAVQIIYALKGRASCILCAIKLLGFHLQVGDTDPITRVRGTGIAAAVVGSLVRDDYSG
jgi:hypothetical protein